MSRNWQRRNLKEALDGLAGEGGDGSGSDGEESLYIDFDFDKDVASSSAEDDEESGFFVKIETIIGNGFQVFSYSSDSIELLKTRIAFQEGIPQNEQNLYISHGKILLNNPKLILSDLGLNEFTSKTRPLRLITNISSGIGSKSFVTRDESSPPLLTSFLPAVPSFVPPHTTKKQGRSSENKKKLGLPPNSSSTRNSIFSDKEPLKLPPLGLDEDNIDGVIVFKDREDRRVFVIIKKKPAYEEWHQQHISSRMKRPHMMSNGVEEIEKRKIIEDMRRGGEEVEHQTSGRKEGPKQLERIRENAKTLQKMNEIRKSLLTKKKAPTKLDDERENQLPEISCTKLPPVSNSRGVQTRNVSTSTSTTFNRTITSSMASLNRLKAEIYLEAKKTGGGSSGALPYNFVQLCRYCQLKIKVLLADQNPEEYNEFNISHRFVPNSEPKTLVPTVVVKRRLELKTLAIVRNTEGRTGRRSNSRTAADIFSLPSGLLSGRRLSRDSSSSTCGSDISNVLKDNNHKIRIATASLLACEEVAKSGRLRRQKSHTSGINKSGNISVRNLRSDGTTNQGMTNSDGSTPSDSIPDVAVEAEEVPLPSTSTSPSQDTLNSIRSTSSTIQKKKKKDSVRCSECRKRIGVACRYQCRCGKMFCAIHRYAEAHTCTFDYKTEGRKQLQEANPVVVASKVDKI